MRNDGTVLREKGDMEKTAQSIVAALAAGTAVAGILSGCVQFSIGESYPPTTTVATDTSLAKDSSNEIEEIRQRARRTGGNSAEISFDLLGTFTETTTRNLKIRHNKSQRLAFGFFPGSAVDEKDGAKVETAIRSLWLNVAFLGMPTVSGLLVEPFVHADNEKCSNFSRSAIFGFHRWAASGQIEEKTEKTNSSKDTVQLKNYTCKADMVSAWVSEDGILHVSGFPAEAKSVDVMISIPQHHPLKDQLAPFVQSKVKIILPEK